MTSDIDFSAVRLYADRVKIHVMLGGEYRNPIAVEHGDLDYKVITKPAWINFVANTATSAPFVTSVRYCACSRRIVRGLRTLSIWLRSPHRLFDDIGRL